MDVTVQLHLQITLDIILGIIGLTVRGVSERLVKSSNLPSVHMLRKMLVQSWSTLYG